MMMFRIQRFSVLSLAGLLFVSSALTGCGTNKQPPLDTAGPILAQPVTNLPKPASNADILYGEEHDDLSTIENAYQHDKKNAMFAARYGKALREAGKSKEAVAILLPFTENKTAGTLVNSELSTLYLADNQLEKAETSARKAIKMDQANYRAWRNLGNALDAQEKYKEGETAFRRSLALWTGEDKVPVMNNLALNLAAQGATDQALAILYQAQKIQPDKKEIERNIRIIRTLSESPTLTFPKKPFPESKLPE